MPPEKLIFPAFVAVGLIGMAVSMTGSASEPLVGRHDASERAAPFVEHFDMLDRDRWFVADGWKNGEYAINDWRSSQVVADRRLALKMTVNKTKVAEYSSGEVQSRSVYGHGYFETRLRAAHGSGLVTGFFTYTGPYYKKPWHEIDVEVLGQATDHVQLTYFTNGKKVKKTIPLGFDASKGFHLYAFDWQPESITWYVDGKAVHRADGSDVPLPSEPQKIMVSLWGSDDLRSWLGAFEPQALPATVVVDCIAYARDAGGAGRCKAG